MGTSLNVKTDLEPGRVSGLPPTHASTGGVPDTALPRHVFP
ncbi:MAG: hypothetical protein OJF50_000265 [Nitrospira sp.]|nr:hypothetical protein [Nitrospira sp.]